MRRADLRRANLTEADLTSADLSSAEVTDEQLSQAERLHKAIMPDGNRYDGRFELPGDIEAARKAGIDTNDAEALARWYTGE